MQAKALGLDDAITAAKAHVQSRKAQLMAQIHAASSSAEPAQLSALQDEADQLGLGDALRKLKAALHARAHAAEGRLELAAQSADKDAFDSCVLVNLSCTVLPVSCSMLQVDMGCHRATQRNW